MSDTPKPRPRIVIDMSEPPEPTGPRMHTCARALAKLTAEERKALGLP